MLKPDIPANEKERLASLYSYNILDSMPEEEYNAITRLASTICNTPISLISLVDQERQWFKAKKGMEANETHRDLAFCAHAILEEDEVFTVEDARNDARFADNPLVTGDPNVVFYSGVPLKNDKGFALGTLCIVDRTPRQLSDDQKEALKTLANQVVQLLELRRKNQKLEKAHKLLQKRNSDLQQFAYVVSHDLKSPLTAIYSFAQLLKEDFGDRLNKQGLEYINYINQSSDNLKSLIDGILAYYKGDILLLEDKKEVYFPDFIASLVKLLHVPRHIQIQHQVEVDSLVINKVAMEQVFINLLTNAIKYNNKEQGKIDIKVFEKGDCYWFSITDNGTGIDKADQQKIFELFRNLGRRDNEGMLGTGIGLSTVKKLIENQEGEITVSSELNEFTTFEFFIKK